MSDSVPEALMDAADELYALLLKAHEGLGPEASARLNARLVLLLMGAVGDPAIVRSAIASAQAAKAERG